MIYDSEKDDGIDKAVMQELASRSGCPVKFRTSARVKIWRDIEDGFLMMSGSGIQNDARDQFAWFIRTMGQKNYVMVASDVRAPSAEAYLGLNLREKWGVIRGYKHGEAADRFIERLKAQGGVDLVSDMDNLFRLLSLERLSVGLAPPPIYVKYLGQYKLKEKIRIEDWFDEDGSIPHGLIFSRKHFSADEMRKWNKLVQEMKADGTLEKIYARYLGKTGARQLMRFKDVTQPFETTPTVK